MSTSTPRPIHFGGAQARAVISLCLAVAVGFAVTHIARAADETSWRAGLASADITPTEPVRMAGYASREKPSEGVASRIHAKALALDDGEGHRAVLITTDLIGLSADYAEPLCRRIIERTGLERRQILLNSSHIHTGPVIGSGEAALYRLPPDQAKATLTYSSRLADQLVDIAAEALENMKAARLSWGTGVATFVMNRREFTAGGVILGVNPRGMVDRAVPVLRIAGADGTLRAVLFGCACHNTTLTGKHFVISGDYAGFAQQHVETAYPGVQAMFMIGCAGDANPYPRGTLEAAQEHGTELGTEVCRVLESDLTPISGPLTTLLGHADLPIADPPPRAELEKMKGGRGWAASVGGDILDVLDRGEKLADHYRAPVAAWQFGDDLTLVALGGEVVVEYVADLEQELGPRKLWVAAYSNDVFGYVPSARILREGGYETRGMYHGGVGQFDPAVEDTLVDVAAALARKAGRKAE